MPKTGILQKVGILFRFETVTPISLLTKGKL